MVVQSESMMVDSRVVAMEVLSVDWKVASKVGMMVGMMVIRSVDLMDFR